MVRVLALLLIPLLFIGPAMSHSHSDGMGGVPIDHDSRPHFHLHSHGHSHDDRHPHHGRHTSDTEQSNELAKISPVSDHDSDAIYLAATDTVLGSSESFNISLISTGWSVHLGQICCESANPHPIMGPPRLSGYPSVYILHSSLQI
jgi:hypothetical protein